MAKVQGVKEKLHSPIYDAFFVPEDKKLFDVMSAQDPRVIRFFFDVQNKTRLETNLQSSGVLPSQNTFEARAMRVVVTPKIFEFTEKNKTYGATEKAKEAITTTIKTEVFLSELIFNSVTSLLVGDKVMIEVPTFYFPSGAGVSVGNGHATNHGDPNPLATFRFAEPVMIDCLQSFRVEMLFPRGVPEVVQQAPGTLHIWVVLDGYLTRDVQ